MFKTLKIFLLVMSLGIFILPKQMLFAQQTEMCCEQKSQKDDCCNKNKKEQCHDENSKDPPKNNCGNDCANCHSCSMHFVFNYISPEIYESAEKTFSAIQLNFGYGISFFSSDFHNIWQPPKIA